MTYAAQLEAKYDVVVDQLRRIGGLKSVIVKPTLPHPQPWAYRIESSFSPTKEGGLGFWAPRQRRVMPIETCHIMQPRLLELLQDLDLDLPGLRKLTLRIGSDGEVLAALEVDGVEPPQLVVNFPLSVAIVLPDRTAASLIGDPYLLQTVKDRDFRVSPGCFFQPSLQGAELLVDTVLAYADLRGTETVLEAYSGVGFLTAFLAERAHEVTAVEVNSDAVSDTAVNLDHTENVTLYEGLAEEILPALAKNPDLMVVSPAAAGLSRGVLKAIKQLKPARLIYISSDIATMARDGKQLSQNGLGLVEVQPLDMTPQAYQVDTVSLWR
jgi:23S rRNA (uracil1939-C5)-methyltransferase